MLPGVTAVSDALVSGSPAAAAAAALVAAHGQQPPPPLVNVLCRAFATPGAHTHDVPPLASVPADQTHEVANFIGLRVAAMLPLALDAAPAPPVALDVGHVAAMLTAPYGPFVACASPTCLGLRLPGQFALRQYSTPAQMAHYHATGQAQVVDHGVCYVCLLAYSIVVASVAGAATLPFFHLVNAPGGYVPDAMHPSAIGDSLLHPVRRLHLPDYVLCTARVFDVDEYDRGVAKQWSQLEVAAYSERAALIFGTTTMPVPRTADQPVAVIGLSTALSCEHVLLRRFALPGASLGEIDTQTVADYAQHTAQLPVSLALTLGGVCAPPKLVVPSAAATLQQRIWLLTLLPLPEARAALLYLVRTSGDWLGVARAHMLMPTQFGAPHADEIEIGYRLGTHMLLYLVLARVHELDRLLGDGAAEYGPVELGRPDAVRTVLALPGIVDQLRAYRRSLQPLHDEMVRRVGADLPVDDAYWWTPDRLGNLLPYLRLAPAPPRDYYTAGDLVAEPLAVAALPRYEPASPSLEQAVNSLPGDGMAISYVLEALCRHDSFAAARRHVPADIAELYWRPPPGCDGSVWRTLSWRVNAAYHVLLWAVATAATLPDDGAAAADAELAAAATSVDAMMAAAVRAGVHVDADVLQQRLRLRSVAQELKRVLASHVPLVVALVDAGATDDAAAEPLVQRWAPVYGWAADMVCDATLLATPLTVHDFGAANSTPQTPYAWVLGAAAPVSGISAVARWQHAAAESGEWLEWSRQAVYASLVGLYAHANNVVPFDKWVEFRRFVWRDTASPLWTNERMLTLVLRDHLVHAAALAPAARLGIQHVYRAWPTFAASVVEHLDRMRAAAGDAAATIDAVVAATEHAYAKTTTAWPPYHRPPPPFTVVLADAVRAVDIDHCVAACIAQRRVLTAAQLAPPEAVVRDVGAWVEREPRPYGAFDAAWLGAVGVGADVAAGLGVMHREYSTGALTASAVQERLRQLADSRPDDYLRVAVLAVVLLAHSRRSLVALDRETAERQARVVGANGTCMVSSVQCCNTMRTHVAQDGDGISGMLPVRLNMLTGAMTCVARRGRSYAEARAAERNGSTAAVARTMERWIGGDDTEAMVRDRLRAYLHPLVRERYTLPCNSMATTAWPVVGAVFVQRNGDDTVVTCTVCPRCGNNTIYAAGMFSSNMFSCGACEQQLRAQLSRAADQQCAFCSLTPDASRRIVQSACATSQLDASRPAHYDIVDDSIAGTAVARRVWVCGTCNERWMPMAATHFSLCELRWMRENTHIHNGDIVSMIDSEEHAALLRDVRRARLDENVAVPSATRVSLLGKPAQRRKRRIGSLNL